ncbi:hexapeptide repeat-containing transferase [Asticcacaulis excentricus]|uniref:Hexapeptide repeat-containing transferase n=1 Tax=Asticcacaulis excentricus (strain ATCC 15261 / DSM 4724 / KCTC 12464 / NCIMB 9791 / VKM B-1370 / CB 48) TaxID=573065 RepID=E8RMQ1_ASTEC|nr:hexapeptide repeat-containing transferase [Asticcacaulis excentricus]ADU13932.1 hexapeptide repeat-containing transferase [Asticcacaulis excentricus CB 48]
MSQQLAEYLKAHGVEQFWGNGINLPQHTVLEAPCSLKWMHIDHSLEMGAFSYAVSGYFFAARIGRYVSMGESIQLGRHNHPSDWSSTSPFFYLNTKLFDVGDSFEGADSYHSHKIRENLPYNVPLQTTHIDHDAWIGHGAYIRPGVRVGVGAIVAAYAVVVKDVPPFAVVAGNPAVVKKYRVPEELIPGLLATEWWNYAPWVLRDLSIEAPQKLIDEMMVRKQDLPKFNPTVITSAEFPR